jgi:hypothetical protein
MRLSKAFSSNQKSDNTPTEGLLKKMWGTKTFIPLLKESLVLLRKYDICLSPQRITTKDNIFSDCLSRGLRHWG